MYVIGLQRVTFRKHMFRIFGRADLIHLSKRESRRECIYSNGKYKEQRKVEKNKIMYYYMYIV